MYFPYSDIFTIKNEETFNQLALRIFRFQYQYNSVYQKFVDNLFHKSIDKINQIQHYTQIPFLPIELFKTQNVVCFEVEKDTNYFQSSGTTGQRYSRHFIFDEKIYQTSVLNGFRLFFGDPQDYLFIFLLPDANERPHSSLIYMANYLKRFSKYEESGFYLNHFNKALDLIKEHLSLNTKLFILGLSYAILDLSETGINFNESAAVILMETGGMKGRREELPKYIFHGLLKQRMNLSEIYSEYGMTELFSQAYSKGNEKFLTPPWMKVLVRDPDDPLAIYTQHKKQGLISIIDLANVYTCSFISTADVGKINVDGSFEILGRSDFSDIRGCNLMYQ